MLVLEAACEIADHSVVKVFTTQSGVAGCREDLEGTLFEREKGYVKGTAAQVVDQNLMLAFELEGC